MKICITYEQGENEKAEAVLRTICALLGRGAKVKLTPPRDGYAHTYITTPRPRVE